MSNTSQYMEVLAKVMRNNNSANTKVDKEKYNKLYYMVNSSLKEQLKKSEYPFAPETFQKYENALKSIEQLYICPEIANKKTVLISNYITSSVFSCCSSVFTDQKFIAEIRNIRTQIPFIIVHEETEGAIEVLNYANVRVSLTVPEFRSLVLESGKRKIALNKVIQYIILKTRLLDSNICIISDNIYATAQQLFSRMISKRIAIIDQMRLEKLNAKRLVNFSALLLDDDIEEESITKLELGHFCRISKNTITNYIQNNVKQIVYGFLEEFTAIRMQILEYYDEELKQTKNTLQGIKGDIVRLGGDNNQILQNRRIMEENKEKKLASEFKEISSLLIEIHEFIKDISTEFHDFQVTGKQISRGTIDNLFDAFFRCKSYQEGIGQTLLSRLYLFDYDGHELVMDYIQKFSGKRKSHKIEELKNDEWEKAKMLLFILNLEKIPQKHVKAYVEILGDRCETGKELYAKAMIYEGGSRKRLLEESLAKGYENAGKQLLEQYKNGDDSVNLMTLANAMLPEACMILADNKLENSKNRKKSISLLDKEFTYYKIAASKSYLPAIGKLVDIIFESRFTSGDQVTEARMRYKKYQEMVSHGLVLDHLCRLLIEKEYNTKHYSEILGIVLFSLNHNLSEAMMRLGRAQSKLAYFCKGNMYEFGRGVSMDLDSALSNYRQAMNANDNLWSYGQSLDQKISKRFDACQYKISKRYNDEDDYYDEDDDYDDDSRYSRDVRSGDDGCFAPGTQILMADGTHRNVEDIRKGDNVMVFDHYKGELCSESIIANVHDNSEAREYKLITLNFEDDKSIKIVKSHVFLDKTDMKYVWLDDENIDKFLSHEFVIYYNHKLQSLKLLNYSVETKLTNYYAPVSRYHLNVFAEGFLTMPPTKLTLNMFNLDQNMRYDLSIVERLGKTRYEDISHMISKEEYSNLPCEYLTSVMALNQCDLKDFEYAMLLFRDQSDYFKLGN